MSILPTTKTSSAGSFMAPPKQFPPRSNHYAACFLLHTNGLVWCIFFCVWLFSLSITSVRLSMGVRLFHCYIVFFYMNAPQFTHSLVAKWLGYFQFGSYYEQSSYKYVYTCLLGEKHSFLLSIYIEVKRLSHRECVRITSADTVKHSSKVMVSL